MKRSYSEEKRRKYNVVDPQLQIRVERLVGNASQRQFPVSTEYVVDSLREQYPMYARKTVLALRAAVDRVLAGESLQRNEESITQKQNDSSNCTSVSRSNLSASSNAMNSSLVDFYRANSPVVESASAKRIQSHEKSGSVAQGRRVKTSRNTGESVFCTSPRPEVRYCDLGGIDAVLQDVRELIEYPLEHPEIYQHLGVDPPRGILLHGPPGCGKTMLARAIAGELGVPFFSLAAPEIVSGMSGESEAKLRSLFAEALELAPSLIFIDEIDAIVPKRETAQREMERRIVAQLLTCLDNLSPDNTLNHAPVIVIGATNRPDSLDPALRRAGRFDREIALGIPDTAARVRILTVQTNRIRLAGDFDLAALARATPGFVGADLSTLTKEAAICAIHRIFGVLCPEPSSIPTSASPDDENLPPDSDGPLFPNENSCIVPEGEQEALNRRQVVSNALRAHREPLTVEQLQTLSITMDDFVASLRRVQPSATREGFSTIPDITWAAVGALDSIRKELFRSIVCPIQHQELYSSMGILSAVGVLLFGPPGCGKTLVARAVANEAGANFIGIKGPQLLNKYVGEAEKAVRQLFSRARTSAPCIIFFDELDALCPNRSQEFESSGSARVVNQLLTEMDGMENRTNVFVVAATNRPDAIDPAMLRPGRLDLLLPVDLPSTEGRVEILRALVRTRGTPLAEEVKLEDVAGNPLCDGFSGADLAGLVREASLLAVERILDIDPKCETPSCVLMSDFLTALGRITPSVSTEGVAHYAKLKMNLHHLRI